MVFHWTCDFMVVFAPSVAPAVVSSVVPPAVPPACSGSMDPHCSDRWPSAKKLSPQLPPQPDVYRLVIETVKNPSTADENIIPWQKTLDMLCSWAAADTEVASPAKCIQTNEPFHKMQFHNLQPDLALYPKTGCIQKRAVGGHFATV